MTKECGRKGCDYYAEGKCTDETYPFCEQPKKMANPNASFEISSATKDTMSGLDPWKGERQFTHEEEDGFQNPKG